MPNDDGSSQSRSRARATGRQTTSDVYKRVIANVMHCALTSPGARWRKGGLGDELYDYNVLKDGWNDFHEKFLATKFARDDTISVVFAVTMIICYQAASRATVKSYVTMPFIEQVPQHLLPDHATPYPS